MVAVVCYLLGAMDTGYDDSLLKPLLFRDVHLPILCGVVYEVSFLVVLVISV